MNEIIKSVEDIQAIGEIALKSGMMQISNSAQAVMKIMAGQEMGIGAFASLSGIHIIKDKPVIGANLMAAAIKSSGKYNYKIREFDKNQCAIEFMEKVDGKWETAGISSFTMEDAQIAGLLDKKEGNNWQRYQKNMLFARAISNGVKWFCPDLFNGNTVYTPDELGQQEAGDANIIEGTYTERKVSLSDLIEQYGAQAVITANDGAVPEDTPEVVEMLKEKLAETKAEAE